MKLTLYLKSKDGADASAVYNTETKECVVKEGSVVSKQISEAPTVKGGGCIRKNREKYVKDGIVKEDVHFKSSSTAGNFVTGRSTDGMHAWKDKKSVPLKELLGR